MSKKHVREIDLTKHIDNVQKFTEDKFHEVGSSSGRPEKVYVKNFSKSIFYLKWQVLSRINENETRRLINTIASYNGKNGRKNGNMILTDSLTSIAPI